MSDVCSTCTPLALWLPRASIVVAIPTRGRPSILIDTLAQLEKQSRRADRVMVAYADAADVADAPARFQHVRFLQSRPGLTTQRNAILDACEGDDIVLFLDDDFYLHEGYLMVMEEVFASDAEIVVATGTLLADGIHGPGLSRENAEALLALMDCGLEQSSSTAVFNAYGCNMALRLEPIRNHGLRFDQMLPLYGWYEDVDFCRQLAPHGRIVQVSDAYGVHLGVKSGRQSGFRLGYSQIANPVYLARKGSVSWTYAIASMMSRSMKNLVRSVFPEPLIDRRGRLQGNLKAWQELLNGSLTPLRVLEI